jgi:hypothetical protein
VDVSLLFLTNQAGNSATTFDTQGNGTTATGYSRTDAIAGPRSTKHRGDIYAGQTALAYYFTADVDLNYAVVARADWLLTANTSRLRLFERDTVGTWTLISGSDNNPLVVGSLTGIRSQDFVYGFTQTQKRGLELITGPNAGLDSQQVSKFYGCNSFSFSSPPSLGFTQQELPIGTYATPPLSTRPYEVELAFTLSFIGLSRSEVTTFKALPQLCNWPLFLYDTAGDIWTHKLEHVIITGWQEVIVENNVHEMQINFMRLRHYE